MTSRSKEQTDRLLRFALEMAMRQQTTNGRNWTITAAEAEILGCACVQLGISLTSFINDCTELSISDFSLSGDLQLIQKR